MMMLSLGSGAAATSSSCAGAAAGLCADRGEKEDWFSVRGS